MLQLLVFVVLFRHTYAYKGIQFSKHIRINKGSNLAGAEIGKSAHAPRECVNFCKKTWVQNGDHCYYWSITKANWAKAEKHCNYCKGHLASVTSEATNEFIVSEIKKQNTAMLWIGGSDKEEQGNWKWTDQSPWSFDNWAGNQTSQGGNCLCYNGTTITPKWNPSKCDQNFKFSCSVKLCEGNVY